jgi:hypothetical protein
VTPSPPPGGAPLRHTPIVIAVYGTALFPGPREGAGLHSRREPDGVPVHYAEAWHLTDLDGAPVRVGVTRDGDVWLTEQARLSPELAGQLAARLTQAAARARELAAPGGLPRG